MQICDLLQHIEISEFSEVMTPYKKLVEKFDVFVDGGAGLGETAAKMMKALPDDDFRIIAFEPNGSNVEAFRETDKRITLIPKAMERLSSSSPRILRGQATPTSISSW